jgi:hypothetical protein
MAPVIVSPRPHRCDLCHEAFGVCITDCLWTCQRCAVLYLSKIEQEREAGIPHLEAR